MSFWVPLDHPTSAQNTDKKLSRCWDSVTCEPLDACHQGAKLHIFYTPLVFISRIQDHRILCSGLASDLSCHSWFPVFVARWWQSTNVTDGQTYASISATCDITSLVETYWQSGHFLQQFLTELVQIWALSLFSFLPLLGASHKVWSGVTLSRSGQKQYILITDGLFSVLASEQWPFPQRPNGGWRMDEACRQLVMISAVSFIPFFDTVGWVTERITDL